VKTTLVRKEDARIKRWWIVDAKGLVLGRLASELSRILRGKNRAVFTPHTDTGDNVIVLNAAGIRLTGNKINQKVMKRYTGYPGGLKLIPYSELMAKRPERALRKAVWGMLPHSVLGLLQIRALKIYRGTEHKHSAQNPVPLKMEKGMLVRAQ
jgi:large subunit ribosomal protein L13